MRHNFIDRYASLDSPLHGLEPRTKILAFTALIVGVLSITADKTNIFLVYAFATIILIGISQVPPGYMAARALIILPFIVLAGLAAPWKGFAGIAVLFARALLSLFLLMLLANTTRFVELLRGLRKLGCPQILVVNLGFLYRYIFVLVEETLRMKQARDCRRVGRAPFKQELKILSSMLGTLLVRSFEKAERMYAAMLSRGYSGDFPVISPKKFSWRDLVFLSLVTIFMVFTLRMH